MRLEVNKIMQIILRSRDCFIQISHLLKTDFYSCCDKYLLQLAKWCLVLLAWNKVKGSVFCIPWVFPRLSQFERLPVKLVNWKCCYVLKLANSPVFTAKTVFKKVANWLKIISLFYTIFFSFKHFIVWSSGRQPLAPEMRYRQK